MPKVETERGVRADAAAAMDGEPGTILVVDDEPLARQMFTDLLEAQGFRVVSVARGEEAFSFLREVDLVLLDAMLPGRDGWEICREIKSRHDSLLPIIMVTARTAPEDVVRTFAVGADDYVAKPFHVAELTARIESRLRVHRAELALKGVVAQLRDLADQNYELYERARADAEERALLLRELDHRVRNNLSVIMGLLSMERNRKPGRAPGEALVSLENRLRSFLLVHEALRRQNYRGVPAREISERLVQRLRNAWDPDRHVEIIHSGDLGSLERAAGVRARAHPQRADHQRVPPWLPQRAHRHAHHSHGADRHNLHRGGRGRRRGQRCDSPGRGGRLRPLHRGRAGAR